MVRFDRAAREIELSVRDLIYLDAVEPLRAEPGFDLRARAGVRAHQGRRRRAEAASPGGYRAERPVEYRVERRGFKVLVHGRIDGLYEEDGRWVVEEVKSVILDPAAFDPQALSEAVLGAGAFADYRLQLELYVLIFRETHAGDVEVAGRLVLVNLAGEAAAAIEVRPDLARVRSWLESRLDAVIDRVEVEERAREARSRAARLIAFPFSRPRPHQEELLAEARASLERGEHLLVSAPTGVGKTAAVLTAALRFALENGLKVFYATAKTTQRRIVAETLERIAAASGWNPGGPDPPPFRAVVLRAREKICPNLPEAGFIYCHEDVCRYARAYSAKTEESGALARLLAVPVALPDRALALGREAEACPFELSLDAALESDVVVGDYNYVFDPESHLRRFFQDQRARDAVLIIDEAHNLYARGREAHSPAIARAEAAALGRWAAGGAEEMAAVRDWCRRVEGIFASLSARGREELGDPPVFPVEVDPGVLADLREEIEEARTRRLVAARASAARRAPAAAAAAESPTDPLDALAARWTRFVSALEALEGAPHLVLYDKSGAGGHRLRVLCLDPSAPLGRRLKRFRSAIAISATLEPLEFYRDVLGFPPERTRTLVFPSPFPEENRRVLVWDRVSTYFRSRARDAQEVARLIEEIAAVEPGNYLVAFSSYAYQHQVLAHLSSEARGRAIVQEPGLSEAERDRTLERLREPGSRRLLLAVQGGIFTEGVDYPGKALIGAIVVGPGLPPVTYDEERSREHFEDRYQEGFEYAYLYPGMNRVIQSAGRVIRSETDVGVIVLLGERFAQGQYARLFPAHWYRNHPRELVSRDLIADLRQFWAGHRTGIESRCPP